ncbi:MAG: tetratricopeptide repeat protein [Lachnospiraceae bacterium]|nr:tetratricopeptide repeat protein [Lachnospiraceae bacterium]
MSCFGGVKKILRFAAVTAALLSCVFITACGSRSGNTEAGMLAIEDGDYEGALVLFSQARDNKENERLILRGEGIAHMGQSDYAGAIESFVSALQLNHYLPEDMDYDINYYLACSYMKNGEPDKAINVYNAIISLHPGDEDAYYQRGIVELQQENADAAIADFSKALSLDPSDYDRAIGVYEALADAGREEDGALVLQSLLEKGGRGMSDYDLGRIYYCMGNTADARESLERAMKSNRNTDTVLALGRVYMADGDYAYAISMFESYLKDFPQCAAVYNEMGLCELERDNPKAALQDFQAGIASEESKGMLQTLKFNEICAYERSGDFAAARDKAAEYVSIWPDDAVGMKEYAFLSTR